MAFNLKATRSDRGIHPDLTEDGDLKADVYLPVAQRDLSRRLADDSGRQHFLEQMAYQQRQEPEMVQLMVQGKDYPSLEAYRQAIQEARGMYATVHGATTYVDDRDIEEMSMARYEELFDPSQGGAARPGVIVNRTSRSVRLDDGRPR